MSEPTATIPAPIILVPGFWLGAWAWDEVAALLRPWRTRRLAVAVGAAIPEVRRRDDEPPHGGIIRRRMAFSWTRRSDSSLSIRS